MSGRDDNDTRRNNHGGTGDPTQWRTGNGDDFTSGSTSGRWPANLILDSEAAAILDADAGSHPVGDSGGASRFFFRADYKDGE